MRPSTRTAVARTSLVRTSRVAAIAAVAAVALTSGCGAAKQASSAAQAAHTAAQAAKAAAGGSDQPTGAPTDDSVRVANLFSRKGVPGPAIDVYDVQLSPYAKTKPTPILTNVAFGSVSDYAHPHLVGSLTKDVILTALPAGSDPIADTQKASVIGGLVDDGSHTQMTFLLQDSGDDQVLDNGPLSGMSISTFTEKGDDGQGAKGPLAPAPTDGSGEILSSHQPIDQTVKGANSYYLFIDGSCTPALNGDPNTKGVPAIFAADGQPPASSFAVFATTPGTHQLALASYGGGVSPTCKTLTPRQDAGSVTVAAGQQVVAFVYGSSLSDLHVLLAPVQP